MRLSRPSWEDFRRFNDARILGVLQSQSQAKKPLVSQVDGDNISGLLEANRQTTTKSLVWSRVHLQNR